LRAVEEEIANVAVTVDETARDGSQGSGEQIGIVKHRAE